MADCLSKKGKIFWSNHFFGVDNRFCEKKKNNNRKLPRGLCCMMAFFQSRAYTHNIFIMLAMLDWLCSCLKSSPCYVRSLFVSTGFCLFASFYNLSCIVIPLFPSTSWRRCRNWNGRQWNGRCIATSAEPSWSVFVSTVWKHQCQYHKVTGKQLLIIVHLFVSEISYVNLNFPGFFWPTRATGKIWG